jgi:hypothetical protein
MQPSVFQVQTLGLKRQIEHGKAVSAAFDLEFRPDRPDVLGSERPLRPGQLAPVPTHSLGGAGWLDPSVEQGGAGATGLRIVAIRRVGLYWGRSWTETLRRR